MGEMEKYKWLMNCVKTESGLRSIWFRAQAHVLMCGVERVEVWSISGGHDMVMVTVVALDVCVCFYIWWYTCGVCQLVHMGCSRSPMFVPVRYTCIKN